MTYYSIILTIPQQKHCKTKDSSKCTCCFVCFWEWSNVFFYSYWCKSSTRKWRFGNNFELKYILEYIVKLINELVNWLQFPKKDARASKSHHWTFFHNTWSKFQYCLLVMIELRTETVDKKQSIWRFNNRSIPRFLSFCHNLLTAINVIY